MAKAPSSAIQIFGNSIQCVFVFKQPSHGSSHVLALLSAVAKDRIADGKMD